MSRLEEARQRLREARDRENAERNDQLATDFDALEEVYAKHGASRVRRVEVTAWKPGIVAMAAVRTPNKAEVRRWQARVNVEKPDRVQAFEELAGVCVVYPEPGPARDALYEACPGLPVQLGQEAASLAVGEAQVEGKE